MNPVTSPAPKSTRWRTFGKVVLLGTLVWSIAVAMVAIETVTLSRDAGALRSEMLAALDHPASAKIQLTVGPALLSAARLGMSCAHGLPDEARAALDAARSASVGVYTLAHDASPKARAKMFTAAEEVMARRGWTRVVGVNNASETVAIYAPTESRSDTEQRLCIAVCEGGKLIVVEARVDGASLVALAGKHLPQLALK